MAQASAPDSSARRFSLDRLQLTSLGVSVGRILPSQADAAGVYSVFADYSEIVPHWRVVAGVSYWESHYRDRVVQTFVDSLNHNLSDTLSGVRVLPSAISLYDVTFSAEGRYVPPSSADIKPFLGLGLAAHVINADGPLINGTLVERALDSVSPGVFITGGLSIKLMRHLGLEVAARADLLSSFRSAQARAGGAYFFGHVRGTRPAGDGK